MILVYVYMHVYICMFFWQRLAVLLSHDAPSLAQRPLTCRLWLPSRAACGWRATGGVSGWPYAALPVASGDIYSHEAHVAACGWPVMDY